MNHVTRQSIAEKSADLAAKTREAWRQDIRNWAQAWTRPIEDARKGMTASQAYRSWTHWDDHMRQAARGRDRGCLSDLVSVRDDVNAAYPSAKEFGEVLTELIPGKVRTAKAVRYPIVPGNPACSGYPGFPFEATK